jgi:hypothetical protein
MLTVCVDHFLPSFSPLNSLFLFSGPLPLAPCPSPRNATDNVPTGHALSNPLPTYLRIPLTWYSSTTHSYFPDESARAIRRVYTSPSDPSSLRQFCGFCGTPLTYWSESPREESDFISLTLGSLLEDDLRDLEDLGLLPNGTHELEGGGETAEADEGVPWFESMVSGSRLGKMRRSLGARRSGRWSVEWEVVEWGGDDASGSASHDTGREIEDQRPASAGKRKLGVDDEDEHVVLMQP